MNCDFWVLGKRKIRLLFNNFYLVQLETDSLYINYFHLKKINSHSAFSACQDVICISQNILGKPLPQTPLKLMTKACSSNSVIFCRSIRWVCSCSMTRFIRLFMLSLVKWQFCFRRPCTTLSPSSRGEDKSIIGEIHVGIAVFQCLNITCGLCAKSVVSRMF